MSEELAGQGPLERRVMELAYGYDLLYDIKTLGQLETEVDYLAHRLSGIAKMRRDDGAPIDEYLRMVLDLWNMGGCPRRAVNAIERLQDDHDRVLALQKASYEREIAAAVAAERERCARLCELRKYELDA